MMMNINDFVHTYKIKNKGTSNIKIYQVPSSLNLNDRKSYFRDGPFSCDIGIVNLHPIQSTLWVLNINEKFFDSNGCAPPQKLSKFLIKWNRHCLYFEYKIQGLTSQKGAYCTSYCLYLFKLTKGIGRDFEPAVLILHHQTIS